MRGAGAVQGITGQKEDGRHWSGWLISKPFDWISTPLYLGACFSIGSARGFLDIGNLGYQLQQFLFVVLATLMLIGIDRYESWRWREEIPLRVATGYFLLRVCLVLFISWVNANEVTLFIYLIIPFSALLYFGSRVGIGVGLVTWLAFVIRVNLFPPANFDISRPTGFIEIFTLCLIFLTTTAHSLIKEKASRTRAERLLGELERSQRQVAELAATRERNRLARDIHDSLGHYLTVISILLGKARAFKEKNPQESDQALSDARRLANEALQDVRESVKSLRTSQELFSLERNLALLVARLQTEQMRIKMEINGSEEGCSKQILMVLFRVAQEGLTNIQRHARCDEVKVKLSFEPDQVKLQLEDNGQGFDSQNFQKGQGQVQTGGYGLQGLQERLEMIGGQFYLDSQVGQGTRLLAIVARKPTKPAAEIEIEPSPAYS